MRDKVCIITGGAWGIGRCLVREMAAAGAKVAFIDKDAHGGKAEHSRLEAQDYDCLFYAGDVARKDDLEGFAQAVVQRYGHVDVLVNNACFSRLGILSDCSWEDFNEVLRAGVGAPYYLTKLLLPSFAPGASVVNISSTRAEMSQADTESYTAAKGGTTALTHALAVSLAGRVRVNSIAPGWIDTGSYYDEDYQPEYSPADKAQHPSNRVGDPQDIARAVMFLCDKRNSFVNGINLTVDGGLSHKMIYHGDEGWEMKMEFPKA